MYDETYEEMKENWKRILDLGPKPFGSEALSQCSHYLEQTLHEITGNACRDIYTPQSEHFWLKNGFTPLMETTSNVAEEAILAERIL